MRGALTAILLVAAAPVLGGPSQPAELPPASFAGQQYVDSRGCLFVRAGTMEKVFWVPRVSRQGEPLCDYPPSGRGAAAEGAAKARPVAQQPEPAPTAPEALGGYYVAVGSFGVQENVEKAEAALATMNYDMVRGRVKSGSGTMVTVFAGPFPDEASADTALAALRESGFPDAMVMRP